MSAEAGESSLAACLSDWRVGHPSGEAVADVVGALAEVGAQVATLLASGPLDQGEGAASGAGPNPREDSPPGVGQTVESRFVSGLSGCDVAGVCSDGTTDPIRLTAGGSLLVVLDPIDGAANVDVDGAVGSIFGVLPAGQFHDDLAAAAVQPGRHLLAAGIIVYGPSTAMALTVGEGTDLYVLDRQAGGFVRARQRVGLPEEAPEYAVNASNARHWGPGIQAYVNDLVSGSLGPRERDFTMHWLACLAAEAYRILRRGGVFLYPADDRPGHGQGRIRLVQEANPVAFVCEQAGGAATDGVAAVLDLKPVDPNQRTPFVFGSRGKVERVRRYLQSPHPTHEESPLFARRGLFRG